MTQPYILMYLEEDVDDATVAEEADKEEDDVGNAGNMPDHGVLQT